MVTLALKTLKQVMEENLDCKNASVTKEKGFRIYPDEEMAAVAARLGNA